MKTCDVLIVGAGFAGLVLAERLSNALDKHCIVIDKRNHIGGNAHDAQDSEGVLVHTYGPHFFHTNSQRIVDYLSQFTEWHPYKHVAKSFTEGRYWSFPINLSTFEQFVGHPSTTAEMQEYLSTHRIPIEHPKNSEEAIISQVGWALYNKFYKGYTQKQWQRSPQELDASVCMRIPIRTARNGFYFDDKFQMMPWRGYSAMFQRMLSPRTELLLNTDYKDIDIRAKWTIYTGPIDEYFGYVHGVLPYRSLRFETQTFKQKFWQPYAVVNYPNDEAFTRIVEIKHATGQRCDATTIVREYPESYLKGKEPYYPVPAPDAAAIYAKYKEMADLSVRGRSQAHLSGVSFVGRLATYKYLDMHQVVGQALAEFEKLRTVL